MIYAEPTEEECYLYAITQDVSGIDLAEFCLIDDTSDTKPLFRAWPFQIAWWRTKEQKTIDAGSRCIKEGTLVLTQDGWQEIQDIQVGTLVLTHKNRWKPVIKVWDEGVKPVVNVNGQGPAQGLTVTENHKFWGRHARRASQPKDGHKGVKLANPDWITAEDFVFSDRSQIMTTRWASPAVPMPKVDWQFTLEPSRDYGKQNYVVDLLSEDFMWLFGLYMAEGSTYLDKQYSRLEFAVHQDEVEYITSVISRLGLNYNTTDSKYDKSAKIRINSRPLTQWFQSNVATGARKKSLPIWVFTLEEKYRSKIFEGMVYGDAHVRPNGCIEYTTSSKKLALDVKLLAQSLGYSSGIQYIPKPSNPVFIGDRQIFPGDSYVTTCTYGNNSVTEGLHNWVGIKSIEKVPDCHVYDIEVEDDHSYIAEGIVVHNSCGKSLSIKLKTFAHPFVNPGEEMVITAPEANHLLRVTNNIENLYMNNKLASEMIKSGRGGIKHRPFQVLFGNGASILGAIPQLDGSGVKGLHPIWLEHDEAQDYPEKGWDELVSTIKFNNPKGKWRVHGVTRGVGDKFDEKISGKDSTWKITNLPAMYRPDWDDQERMDKIEEFHGYDSDGYKRNVLGLPSDGNSPMFLLSRIMQNVTIDLEDNYNALEYYYSYINEAELKEVDSIEDLLAIPAIHKSKYKNFWIGMDVGWTISPSAIVVFAEVKNPKKDQTDLKLLSRIILKGISGPDQLKTIMYLMDVYRPVSYAMDASGTGQPLWQFLYDEVRKNPDNQYMIDRIKDYQFSSKVTVGFDPNVEINEIDPEGWKEAAIERPFLEASADAMRVMIDEARMALPYDKELIGELQSTPKNPRLIPDAYGKSTHRKTGQHSLDAIRMAVLAQQTHHIDEFIARHQNIWTPPAMILM